MGHRNKPHLGLAGLLLSACIPKHSQVYSARISTELVAMQFERQQELSNTPKICQRYEITTNGNPATLRVVYEEQDENKRIEEDSWQSRLSLEYTFKGDNKGIEWARMENEDTGKGIEEVHWRRSGASKPEEKLLEALTPREREWYMTLYTEGIYFLASFMQSSAYVFQDYVVDCGEQDPKDTVPELPVSFQMEWDIKYLPLRFEGQRAFPVPYFPPASLFSEPFVLSEEFPRSNKELEHPKQKYTPEPKITEKVDEELPFGYPTDMSEPFLMHE